MGIPSIETHQSFAALTGSMMAFSTITVVLRFYLGCLQKEKLKADDWIMISCLVCIKFTDSLEWSFAPRDQDAKQLHLTRSPFLDCSFSCLLVRTFVHQSIHNGQQQLIGSF
jgi:hypothetical protein